MKSTPNVSANGQKTNTVIDNTAKVVPLSDLINTAKGQNPESVQPDDIKEPTTYAQPAPEAKEETSEAPKAKAEPAENPEAPKVEPIKAEPRQAEPRQAEPAPQTMALVPVRSRADEIAYLVEKARQTQLINTQLTSLTAKRDELKTFSYGVDKDDDHRYGRLVIYDDNNREFTCKNHGVAALVVEFLRTVFSDKIEEKENDLLNVSKS